VIAEIIADYPDLPLIVDPVLASGRGDELADDEMIAQLASRRIAAADHDPDAQYPRSTPTRRRRR
jgi:hydroxymethylpyrimidine/phosphomethylpyrimidine kinase